MNRAEVSLLLAAATVCRADSLIFSYLPAAGGTFGGTLPGTLQGDNHTFFVAGVGSLTWNRTIVPFSPATVESTDYSIGFTTNPAAVVTVNGGYLDLTALDTTNTIGFQFFVGDQTAALLGPMA